MILHSGVPNKTSDDIGIVVLMTTHLSFTSYLYITNIETKESKIV